MRWVAVTLLLIVGATAVRVTMLDDTWLRLMLAGGDRIGLLAEERRLRAEAQRAEPNPPAVEVPVPASEGAEPPAPKPLP